MWEARSSKRPRSGWRRSLAKLLLLTGALLLSVCLGEGLLRLLGISYPQFYAPDFHCASRLRAGVSGWWMTEGHAFVRINSDGLRDREHTLKKAPGTVRVAVLGDSYSESLQVNAEKAYWAVAQRQLNQSGRAGGVQFEFINFGVSGYGTAQALLMLRNYVWKYDPDIVVLAFCHNDVRDNSKELASEPNRPYFVLRDDRLVLDNSFRDSLVYQTSHTTYERTKAEIINRSYLLQVLKRAKFNWENRRSIPGKPEGASGVVGFDILSEPQTNAARDAWRITERLIVQTRDEVAEKGARFLLMTVTAGRQVRPSDDEGSTADYPERRLTRLARDRQFPILTLAEPLARYACQKNVYLHGFANSQLGTGHWNEQGHRLAGIELADQIRMMMAERDGQTGSQPVNDDGVTADRE